MSWCNLGDFCNVEKINIWTVSFLKTPYTVIQPTVSGPSHPTKNLFSREFFIVRERIPLLNNLKIEQQTSILGKNDGKLTLMTSI